MPAAAAVADRAAAAAASVTPPAGVPPRPRRARRRSRAPARSVDRAPPASRRIAFARTTLVDVAEPDGCHRDGRRRTGGVRQGARDPWQSVRCRRGDGIAVFSEGHAGGCGGGCLSWYIIHPIAIRRSVPAPGTWMTAGWPRFGERAWVRPSMDRRRCGTPAAAASHLTDDRTSGRTTAPPTAITSRGVTKRSRGRTSPAAASSFPPHRRAPFSRESCDATRLPPREARLAPALP